MARTPATLKDIAAVLGLSHATVSRALANHPKVSPRTKTEVARVAHELGYVPNGLARNIRNPHSPVVGLIVPDIQNDFYASIAKIVADSAQMRGLQLALSITEDNPQRELNDLRSFLVARAAGVIITPTANPERETLELLRDARAIQLVRQHPQVHKNAVVIDDRAAIGMSTQHLIHYGHRRIGYVGTTTDFSCGVERLGGFQDAVRQAGLDDRMVAVGIPRSEFARYTVERMMTRPDRPSALVIGSSSLTLGTLKALRALGLSCPKDVSVVGYGDPEWFDLVGEGLTTVSLPVQAMGGYVINMLLGELDLDKAWSATAAGAQPDPPLASRFAAALTIRASTRPLN